VLAETEVTTADWAVNLCWVGMGALGLVLVWWCGG